MPWSAEALTAKLLDWMVGEVVAQNGGPPERVVVTHPANWGPFKHERMAEVLRLAGSPAPETVVSTMTEPAAAAAWYAAEERVQAGQVIAVYDLGGGTFDATLLRKRDTGFELLGEPAGVERLGGMDIDEAVMAHVRTTLGSRFGELEPDDLSTVRGLARLRSECVEAKEALSADAQVTIPVDLPGLLAEVRLTRAELEAMSQPLLEGSIAALARTIRSAGLGPDEVDRVLLVGGGSRMPLVARLISGAFGRPVFVDAHPKHAVCLGAALTAASLVEHAPAAATTAAPGPVSPGPASPAVPGPAAEGPAPPPRPPRQDQERQRVGDLPRHDPGRGARALAGLAVVLVVVLSALLVQRRASNRDDGDDGDGTGTLDLPVTSPSSEAPGPDPAGGGDEGRGASLGPPVNAASPGRAGDLGVAADSVWVAGGGDQAGYLVRHRRSLEGNFERYRVTPDGYVGAVDVDANRVWATVVEPASTPASDEGVTGLMSLVVLDPTSGDVIGESPVGPSTGEAHLVVDEDAAWLVTGRPAGGASSRPALHRASLADGGEAEAAEVLVLDAGLTVQDVAVWDDRVWTSATEGGDESGPTLGRILAVDTTGGERVPAEDIVLNDGAVGPIEAGPDGLWFAEWRSVAAGGERVVRFDPASRRVVDEVPRAPDPTGAPHVAPAGDTTWFTHRGEVHRVDVDA